jgi:predicted P-loop ATPase
MKCIQEIQNALPYSGNEEAFVRLLSAKCNRMAIPIKETKILIKKKSYNFDDEKVTKLIEEVYAKKEEFGKDKKPTIETFLSSKYDFRYNEVTGKIEFKISGKKDFEELTDYNLNSIYRKLGKEGYKIGIDRLNKLLQSDFVQMYNPFKEYFNNLPEWDGHDYIKDVSELVKTDDNDFWYKAFTKWLVGMVATSLDDKSINHTVIVFSGKQGIGKSTFIRNLLPPELQKYMYSGLINPSNKDSLILMTENIIIDLDELANLNKREDKELKEIITKANIKLRRPYGRITENLPRRASFIGSINDSQFLSDISGNRRYLCFLTESFNYNVPIDYNGLYSQIMHLYKENFKFWFEGEENDEINERNEKFRIKSNFEEILFSKYSLPKEEKEVDVYLTASDLLNEFRVSHGIQMNQTSNIQIGKLLTGKGFPKKKKGGVYKYGLKFNNQIKRVIPEIPQEYRA